MTAVASGPVWGVGQIRLGSTVRKFPVTYEELLRDSAWAGQQLARHQLPRGKFMMIVSMSNEGAHIQPFDAAAASAGIPLCQVDAVAYEAPRIISVLKNLPLALVLGMPLSIIGALAAADVDIGSMFSETTVLVRPEASEEWRAHTSAPRVSHWYPLGPAVALDCPAAAGAHVNGAEWDVHASGTELLVSGLVNGRQQLADVPSGRHGHVVTARCECGSDDPRIVLDSQ